MKDALCHVLFRLRLWVRGFGYKGWLISRGLDPGYWHHEYGHCRRCLGYYHLP